MNERIRLGKVKENCVIASIAGETIYLNKHSFDCGWYWGFGYIGNNHMHTHFDNCFLGKNISLSPDEIFESTKITEAKWWIIKDLFKQAYALKNAAEVYQYGGHCCGEKEIISLIRSKEKAEAINDDLKVVLDRIWKELI